MPWLPSLSLPQPRKGCSDSGGTLARPEQAGQGCSSLREHSCCHPEGQADIPGHSQGDLWALQGGRCLASSAWVMERGARGGQGVYSTALFWVTSVIKGWKDPWELLGGVLLLQNSGKGLLDAGAGKGKGPSKTSHPSNSAPLGAWEPFPLPSSSVSTLASQVCPGSWCKPPQPFGRAWSCMGKQKFPVSKCSQTAPAGNAAPLGVLARGNSSEPAPHSWDQLGETQIQ